MVVIILLKNWLYIIIGYVFGAWQLNLYDWFMYLGFFGLAVIMV